MMGLGRKRRERRELDGSIAAAEQVVLEIARAYVDQLPAKTDDPTLRQLHTALEQAERELHELLLRRRLLFGQSRAPETETTRERYALECVTEYVGEVANPVPDYPYRSHCRKQMIEAIEALSVAAR